MVKLSNIKKEVIKYFNTVEQTWTIKDYHYVTVTFFDENNVVSRVLMFGNLQDYFDFNDETEYHSIQIEYDPIIIQFPSSRKSNLCY